MTTVKRSNPVGFGNTNGRWKSARKGVKDREGKQVACRPTPFDWTKDRQWWRKLRNSSANTKFLLFGNKAANERASRVRIAVTCRNGPATAVISDWIPSSRLRCGQTTGDIWAPKYYIFPRNDFAPVSSKKKKIRKIPKKIQAKASKGTYPGWI